MRCSTPTPLDSSHHHTWVLCGSGNRLRNQPELTIRSNPREVEGRAVGVGDHNAHNHDTSTVSVSPSASVMMSLNTQRLMRAAYQRLDILPGEVLNRGGL